MSDILICISAGTVKQMDPVLTHRTHLKLNYNTIISRQVLSHIVHAVLNNFLASKAHQKPQWLQLISHSWLAIKLCASMMMIMLGNNGFNACQRGNTGDISTSKTSSSSSLQQARRTRMKAMPLTASGL